MTMHWYNQSPIEACAAPGTPVSSSNKIDRHDIAEILLKVALNTITHNSVCDLAAHASMGD
jgi:hypothetical protein